MAIYNFNILNNFSKNNYYSEPYPHFIINKVFNEETINCFKKDYELIVKEFQKLHTYKLNNKLITINATEILGKGIYKKTIWYDFCKYHTSKDHLLKIFEIFYEDLNKLYPGLCEEALKYKNQDNFINIRNKKEAHSKDNSLNENYYFVADVQPAINTPVFKKSTVRGPHVDSKNEIIGGLFYIRDENDSTEGGDLEIFEIDTNTLFNNYEVSTKNVPKKFKVVAYRNNTAIFFINSKKSVHAVSPRNITNHNRYLINMIIEKYKNTKGFFELKQDLSFLKKTKNYLKKFIK